MEEDIQPEVKLASGPSTALKGEVEKIKGKEMTHGCEALADRLRGT